MRPVTFETFDNVRKLIGWEYRNECQRIVAHEILDHDEVVFQAYRQFFKSHFVKNLGCAYVFNDGTPIIASPTLTQSSRIIYRGIKQNMTDLLRECGLKLRREPDTTTETVWWDGKPYDSNQRGALLALSANMQSVTKPEGYTGDFLGIDEGHNVPADMLGVFTPMLSDSRAVGTARVLVTGSGGHKSMAIEALKKRGYHVVVMSASRAVEIDPTLAPLFEKYRAELSQWEWDKYYACKEIKEGLLVMFPVVAERIETQQFIDQGLRPLYYFGIDVGRVSDSTVVKVIERWGNISNEIATFNIGTGLEFHEQAEAIYNWIDKGFVWHPSRIAIELNGPGYGLFDPFNKIMQHHGTGMYAVGLVTDEEMKEDTWHWINTNMREGKFGVAEPAEREKMEGMMYNVREKDAKIDFEHCDHHSARIMALQFLQG